MPKNKSKVEIYEEKQVLLSKERTILSKERTILSFMQTGLAFVTVGIAIFGVFGTFELVRIVSYILIGIGFVEVFESVRRLLVKQKELNELRKSAGSSYFFFHLGPCGLSSTT